jgi:hypothetical protein
MSFVNLPETILPMISSANGSGRLKASQIGKPPDCLPDLIEPMAFGKTIKRPI